MTLPLILVYFFIYLLGGIGLKHPFSLPMIHEYFI